MADWSGRDFQSEDLEPEDIAPLSAFTTCFQQLGGKVCAKDQKFVTKVNVKAVLHDLHKGVCDAEAL
jgi:hypothetical protein